MLFSSFTFLLIFLPLTLILYYIIPNRTYRNVILFISSLIFYSFGEPKYILLMLIMIAINYVFGLLIGRYRQYSKVLLILDIIINIGTLVYFKYLGFIFNDILNLNKEINIILSIGISFYTFQILSYVIDVYRGKVEPQKNIMLFGLYVSLFPQLVAGPIVRYKDVSEQLKDREENWNNISYGLCRFIIGLAKKIIISNNVAIVANEIFKMPLAEINFTNAWLGVIAFTLQIYFDFGGYSDMAIGLGKMFGFDFMENFNYPYIAKSITDFWRRWHISLSTFFKDYVYIPLGGNRKGLKRQILNLFIVWSLAWC